MCKNDPVRGTLSSQILVTHGMTYMTRARTQLGGRKIQKLNTPNTNLDAVIKERVFSYGTLRAKSKSIRHLLEYKDPS